MKRNNNAYNQQVTLFIGITRIIILNSNRQIDYALRTIRLTQKILYTYHSPPSSSKAKSKNNSIPLEELIKYEHQYIIRTNMRPKLLLSKYDSDIKQYLKQLKAPELKADQNCNIVAIANEDKNDKENNFINGFIFSEEEEALKFYQGLNQAIASQIYFQIAQASSLPFNYKLSNFLGDVLNGNCVIDPQDYTEQKVQEQLQVIYDVLKMVAKQKIINFRDEICKLQLCFKIIDQESRGYACNFMACMQANVQKLVLSNCELNSKEFKQVIEFQPFKLGEKMTELLHLDLSNNNLKDDFFQAARNLLTNCKKLHNFNLSYNNITIQNQEIVLSFLAQINIYKVVLNLRNNKIKNTTFILKYFINADGIIPVQLLNISENSFDHQDIALIVKNYLHKTKNKQNQIKIIVNQVQFEDAHSFQFLTRLYRTNQPTVLNVPLSLSKHPFRKKGKQIGNNNDDINKFAEIDKQLKNYGTQIFLGNFYQMKKIKDRLIKLQVDQQAIQGDSKHLKKHRKIQQQMIIKKIQSILNFNVKCRDVIKQLNQTITFMRRKGLTGQGVNCLAYIKFIVQQKLQKWRKQNNLGLAYRQCLFNNQLKYTNLYLNDSEMIQLKAKYPTLINLNQKALTLALYDQQNSPKAANSIAYSYFLLQERPAAYQRIVLEHLLTDPLLSSAKIIRDSNLKKILFEQSERVGKVKNTQKMSSIEINSKHGLQNYRFNQTFIQSRQSSSEYKGMLSTCKFDAEDQPIIKQFIQTFYNFMVFLYLKPDGISEQTICYIKEITKHLMDKQNQKQNDLKCALMEEFIIRMITFYDSQKYRPLKHGLLLSICEHILRRIEVEEQLRLKLTAHFIRFDNFKQQQINFHVSNSKFPWEGKVDWIIDESAILKQLIIKRGKIEVSIADISNQNLKVPIQIDQLDTVTDLWVLVRQNIEKIAEYTNINKNQLNFYWLAGKKTDKESWDLQLLPSYEHIGKLIFQNKFSRTLILKRTIFPPEYHSTAFLTQLNYEYLLCLFKQARQNYRQSAHIILNEIIQAEKVKLTADVMWIETLIQEEIVLVALRRQQSQQILKKYRQERQEINSKSLEKLYAKYMPTGFTFNQQNRNSLIAELQNRVKDPIPKVINQAIRENIINLISNLGVCAFTTTLADSNKTSHFYCNNKLFCFEDKSQIPSRKIYVHFKHLLWFEAVKQPTSHMKFDIIENISQEEVERYQFTIHGSSCWLGQIYSIIINVCNLRLNFPNNLLCNLQDCKSGVSDSILVSQTNVLLNAPPLQLSNLFEFTLPREKRKLIIQNVHNVCEQFPPSIAQQYVQIPRRVSIKQINQTSQQQLPIPIIKQQRPLYSRKSKQNFEQRQAGTEPQAVLVVREIEGKQLPMPARLEKQQKQAQDINSNQNVAQKQQKQSISLAVQTQKKIPVIKNQSIGNPVIDKSKNMPIPPIRQQPVQSSSRRPSQQSLQIQQITHSVSNSQNQKQNQQQVIKKRSSIRNSGNNSRRKSKNH